MRRIICLAAAMLLMMLFGYALADGPTNPYFYEAQPPSRYARATYAISVDVECVQGPSYDADTCWVATATGGDGNYQYRYYVLEAESWDVHGYRTFTSDAGFAYRFIVPGDYDIYVQVEDGSGNAGYVIVDCVLEDDGRMTVADKVSQLASECSAACRTDFEKALWFHDWLIYNACYDESLTYYSADSILLRGTGVCDGYSKAYQLLLRAVGISTERCTGGNHAWNYVNLDGEWYHIDPTWDDPTGGPVEAVSGYENHYYFGLPDEIMSLDHSYSATYDCTAYESNYFIKTGKVEMWVELFEEGIAEALSGKNCWFEMDIPTYYPIEKEGYMSRGKEQLVYGITGYELTSREWQTGDRKFTLTFEYDNELRKMQAEVDLKPYTMTIPEGVKVIDAEAFENTGAYLAVELPEGVESVGERVFAECTELWKVVLPDSLVSFPENALDGCGNVTVYCNEGSTASGLSYGDNVTVIIE